MKSIRYEIASSSRAAFVNHTGECIGTGRMGLALRQEYLEDVKANFRAQMENTSIKEPDGTIHRVMRRADLKSQD